MPSALHQVIDSLRRRFEERPLFKSAIGFLAGIAFAVGCWALLGARHAGRPQAETTDSNGLPESGPAGTDPAETTRPSLLAVEAEIAKLEAEAAALKARPAATAAKKRLSFADIAKKLVPAFAEDTWIWETDDERTQALIGPFLEELRARAIEKGISLYEAAQGPDGVAALAMAMLAAMDPPPDAETMKKLEEARAALGKEFDGYLAKRDSLSRLEQYREILDMGSVLSKAEDDNLSEAASDTWRNAGEFWDVAKPSEYLSFYTIDPSSGPGFDNLCRDWTDSWSAQIGLDALQKLALKPIVDEYARATAELNADADKRTTGNIRAFPSRKDQLALMIRATNRIAAETSLNEAQRKALRDLSQVPSHQLRSAK